MRKGFELGRNLEDVSQKDPSSHAERKSPPYTETLAGSLPFVSPLLFCKRGREDCPRPTKASASLPSQALVSSQVV